MAVLLFLLALLALPAFPTPQTGAGPPIREQELLRMVGSKGLFTEEQILEVVESRGIGFRLTEALRRTLKKQGAGPKLMEALEKAAEALKRQSVAEEQAAAEAAAPKPVPPPPELDPAAQGRLLEDVRRHALEYSDKMPNFICLQVTKRMVDFEGKGFWQMQDVIQARLAYNDHRESYQVVAINDQLSDRSYDSLGGATSAGEFATLLRALFSPETAAFFTWAGPASFRGRPVYAFDYYVARERSTWHIIWQKERTIIPAYRGRAVVDAETHRVLRLWMVAEDIPADFPIRAASTALEYDYAKIAGQAFLLPARAIVEMKEGRLTTRNEIQFRQYRRFTAETKLIFEEPRP